MKSLCAVLALVALAGCWSPKVPSVSCWSIDYTGKPQSAAAAKYGVARVSQVVVRNPYNAEGLVVLRSDGTLAVDALNTFAASPAQLLKGFVFDVLAASGLFVNVVDTTSAATAAVSVETVVSRLALDCTQAGRREAVVELAVRLLEGRSVLAVVPGEGRADAADGNYGKAFSQACAAAFDAALGKLR